jgi:hypothetical protein
MRTDTDGDLLDGSIRVLARLTVLETELGGREGPIFDKYRPNHDFGDAGNSLMYDGQISVPDDEGIYPGQRRDVWITFLNRKVLSEILMPGRQWRIQEGPQRLVATAEVLSVIYE